MKDYRKKLEEYLKNYVAPTTVAGWLNLAEAIGLNWAKTALVNTYNFGNSGNQASSMHGALAGGFAWANTEEGHAYWQKKSLLLSNIEIKDSQDDSKKDDFKELGATPTTVRIWLTKREIFAAMAMQGLLAGGSERRFDVDANMAVQQADALIKELKKRNE